MSRSRSSSQNSSKSLPADNVQLLVKINALKTIPLNVQPSNSIADVLTFLSASATFPSDVRLLRDGSSLDPSSTVKELELKQSTTLELQPPILGGTPPPAGADKAVISNTETLADKTATVSGSVSATPTATSTPKKKSNKPRCAHPPCKAAAQPIMGDCGFCQKIFCGKHRMLESHSCEGLEDAKKADRDRNTAKLEGERTLMMRGI